MKLLKSLLTCILIVFSINAFSQTYYVNKVVSKHEQVTGDTLRDLIISSLEEKDAMVADTKFDADYSLDAKLIKLGSVSIISIYKSASGKKTMMYKARAESIEGLDPTISKLTGSIVGETPKFMPTKVSEKVRPRQEKEKRRVGKIKDEEVEQISKRRESRNFTHFGFGAGKFQNSNNDEMAYYFRFANLWDVHEQAAIKFIGDLSVASSKPSAIFGAAGLGMNYYFTDGDVAPYVGADLGYGISSVSKYEDKAGFAYGLSVGAILFRTSGAQFGIEGRYQSLLVKNQKGKPGVLTLSIGIYY